LRTVIRFALTLCLLIEAIGCRSRTSEVPQASFRKVLPLVSDKDAPFRSLSGLGTVAAFNTVVIRTRVDGQIKEVHFREGDDVRQGDLLFVLDQRPYLATLKEAEATRASDYSKMEDAKANMMRDEALLKDGVISKQQFETQSATYNQLQASTDADDARIQSANVQLSYTRISAPISGRVGLRQIDLGNIVRASDPVGLVTIMQIDPIVVVFTLPANELTEVMRSMNHGTVAAEAFGDDGHTPLARGKVVTADDAIDVATGLAKLKAVFNNGQRRLWPNQFVNIRLILPKDPTRRGYYSENKHDNMP
jgi:membrane fusion protein, multidrug efflux system